ncbi:MAG: Asp-tRNA(Asn)/Glu-tRNA(Gln) amidotransferase subunit GatB [Acidobacteriota bacterium]
MGFAIPDGWEAVIGLEVHAQLLTESKIFCSCPTSFGASPNAHTCPVCLGHPGVLPVLNRKAVEHGLRMALATGGRIAARSVFARKNYFYPDLPKGYQISQYDLPLAQDGAIDLGNGTAVGLCRIHLEEDAGKLLHEGPGGADHALVDYNRAGVPLLEIVSKPEIPTPGLAHDYLEALRRLVMHLGVCDGNMEEGSLRCDANVSVRRPGDPLGVRTEIKNLNSFRNVERALEHEIARHVEVLAAGGSLSMETRGFDADRGATYPMRGKEEAHDYRYFPEPDLPALHVDASWIARVRESLPELPAARRARLHAEYGLSAEDASLLTASRELADYYEAAARASGNPRSAASWVLRDVLREIKEAGRSLASLPVSPASLGAMIRMIDGGSLSSTAGRDVFAGMLGSGGTPEEIARARGLLQLSDEAELVAIVERVLSENEDAVRSYRAGKEKSFGFLVGAAMKLAKGRGNPKLLNEILRRKLAT